MEKYIAVISHLSNDYVTKFIDDEQIDEIEEICETCGDSDYVMGVFDSEEEAWEAIENIYFGGQ